MTKCPNCSASVKETRHYCPKCGAALLYIKADTGKAEEAPAAKNRLTAAICCGLIAVIMLFALLYPRQRKYTDPNVLAEEYIALFEANKAGDIAELFLPGLTQRAELSQLDVCYSAYGLNVDIIGIYDVSESSELNSQMIERLLRNNYGIQTEVEGYARLLTGVVADGVDVWFNIDAVLTDGGWYIVQIVA